MTVCTQAAAMDDRRALVSREMKTIDGRPVYPSLERFFSHHCVHCKQQSLDCAKRNITVFWYADEEITGSIYILKCDLFEAVGS